jgi:hypothetical protein
MSARCTLRRPHSLLSASGLFPPGRKSDPRASRKACPSTKAGACATASWPSSRAPILCSGPGATFSTGLRHSAPGHVCAPRLPGPRERGPKPATLHLCGGVADGELERPRLQEATRGEFTPGCDGAGRLPAAFHRSILDLKGLPVKNRAGLKAYVLARCFR